MTGIDLQVIEIELIILGDETEWYRARAKILDLGQKVAEPITSPDADGYKRGDLVSYKSVTGYPFPVISERLEPSRKGELVTFPRAAQT